jgi:zinc ribbon protein
MGKLSDEDFGEMAGRLRARAAGLIRQLDAGAGYREQIERDVSKKLETDARFKPAGPASTTHRCAACAALNDQDARFCKHCGARL